MAGHQGENARAVRGFGPENRLAGAIAARVNERVQPQQIAELRHLGVRAADINCPAKARAGAHHLLLPAQTFDAAFCQRLPAG